MKKILFTLGALLIFAHLLYADETNSERQERLLDAIRNWVAITPRQETNIQEAYRLINEGIDVNIADSNGWTPLLMASGEDWKLAEFLISKGANINVQNDYGETALMLIAKKIQDTDVDGFAFAKLLISKGINIDITDAQGRTSLMIALEKNNKKLVEFLILQGADVKLRDNLGNTVLMHCRGLNNELVDLLISKGVDINAQNNEGRTILMMVVGNLSLVEYLIEKGANPDLKDKNGMTALDLAITHRGFPPLDSIEYLRSVSHLAR